jgi:thiamine pyrophosphate-dependent acetolactate synthase large subunit-like protein
VAYISGGLTEIQQVRAELEQIRTIINELEPKLERAPQQLQTFRQLESVARRYLILVGRMGFKGNVVEAINQMSRLLMILRQAQIAAQMLKAALFMGAGPIGILGAGASVGLVAASAVNFAQDSGYDNTWGV